MHSVTDHYIAIRLVHYTDQRHLVQREGGTWLGATHPVPDHPARTSVPTSYYLLYMAQIHKAIEQVFDGDILTKYRQRCYQALRLQEKDKEGLGLVNW